MRKYFAFFFASCLMVGFQNCGAPMQFQEAVASQGDLSQSDLEEIGHDGGSIPGEPTVDNGDGTETTMPIPDGEEPVGGEVPGEPGEPGDGGSTGTVGENPGNPTDPTDPTNPPGEDVDPFSCAGLSDAVPATTNECKAAIKAATKYLTLDDGASIKNFAGNFTAKSGHVVQIQNTKGNLILVGIGHAYVESINDTKGNLTICNMDVGAVESVSAGNISIDGGNVCRVVGHKGNVKITNGSVGEVNYNKGNISVVNGNVGNINAHTGNISIKNGTVKGTITNSVGNIKISN